MQLAPQLLYSVQCTATVSGKTPQGSTVHTAHFTAALLDSPVATLRGRRATCAAACCRHVWERRGDTARALHSASRNPAALTFNKNTTNSCCLLALQFQSKSYQFWVRNPKNTVEIRTPHSSRLKTVSVVWALNLLLL